MALRILTVVVRYENDTVAARQRARQIAKLVGFDPQDQTRICTAVSEIARNAFNYAGGGRVEYLIEGRSTPQLFIVKISDTGGGIPNLDAILEGRYESRTGMGLGIIGARRLMDQFEIKSEAGKGTTVFLKKLIPKRAPLIKETDLPRIATALSQESPQDALQELQHQNQELLNALEEIRTRQTELTRLNRELGDTNRGVVALYAELDEKADHLRRADELKSRFLSNMSHEFRSPLNSILALSGLLLDPGDHGLNAEQQQEVGYIKKAAWDLLELVNDLLDLAKVEAGKIEAKPIDFDVSDLFAALRGMLRPLLLNQMVNLIFEDIREIPPMFSDEGKVSQILRNFISNSLKFTEKGEVRVSAELVGGQQIKFSVSDTGIGIAKEDHERIFQDFTQVDNPIQRRVKGTGLGLPLSKRLATILGGSVAVESQPGVGSTFTLQLPLKYCKAVPQDDRGVTDFVLDPASVPVLVVEDSPDMVLVYKSFLKDSGFQVLFARTTAEAEELLERVRPRAIVLDIVLRSEDSWAFLAQLKNDPATASIPILVASSIDDQAKGFHLGIEDYMTKPIQRAVLLERLKKLAAPGLSQRILIIDNDERDRYVLKQQLVDFPFVISEASDGIEGLAMASREKPQIIFLDLGMPGMDGFEVLAILKAQSATAGIPVIINTSMILTEEDRRKLENKAAAILSKEWFIGPDSRQILLRTLHGAGLPAPALGVFPNEPLVANDPQRR